MESISLYVYTCTVYLFIAVSSIVAQFKGVDPYHWPGWFTAAIAALMATAVLFCFRETRTLSYLRGNCTKCSHWSIFKLSFELKAINIVWCLVSFTYTLYQILYTIIII